MRVRVIIRDEEKVRIRKQFIAHVYLDAITKSHEIVEAFRAAYPGQAFMWETRFQKGGKDEYQTLERGNQETLIRES